MALQVFIGHDPLDRFRTFPLRSRAGFLRVCVRMLAVCVGLAAAIDGVRASSYFPFSVWYSGGKARAPMLEEIDESSRQRWKSDLEQIRNLGFNTVRTWVEWTACEPTPGRYRFENLELLLELAAEVDLKVKIQMYVDSAPDWVAAEFKDARFVAQSGAVITSQAAPGYCTDHPQVRERILEFYRETARRTSRFPNFAGWDLWSEPHVINWAIIDYIPNASFCYCPHTIARFRHWLQDRHGTLEALNRAWYRTFTDWSQVEPPRFGTILTYTDFIDWRLFIQDRLAQDLALRAQAVRSVDPSRIITSHAAVPSLFTSPTMGVGAPDDWLMTEGVDFYGTSIYPKHSFPERHWDPLRLSVILDFTRSSGRLKDGFYIGELQAGRGIRGTVVGDPVTAQDHRKWAWGALSRGARAINVYAYYPMNSGYEAGGYGLVELDGSLTERAREIGRIASLVDRNAELFLQGRSSDANVAVIYNPLSQLVGGEQHLGEASALRDSLIGIYRAFWRRNLPVDFVHRREVEQGGLASYRIAFLPYSLMMTAPMAEQLKAFVRSGGVLVAEARTGWNDDRGFSQDVIPGFGLHEVFQVREGELRMSERVPIRLVPGHALSSHLPDDGLLEGQGIQSRWIPETETEILGRFEDGTPAVTSARYGNGQAVAVGSFVGMAHARRPDPVTEAFFLGLAAAAGVQPVVPVVLKDDDLIEARLLAGPAGELLFLINHGQSSATAQVNRDGADFETGERVDAGAFELGAGEVRVIRLE